MSIEIKCLTSYNQLYQSLHICFWKEDRVSFPSISVRKLFYLFPFTNMWSFGSLGLAADEETIQNSLILCNSSRKKGFSKMISSNIQCTCSYDYISKIPPVDCQSITTLVSNSLIFTFRSNHRLYLAFLLLLQIKMGFKVLSELGNQGFQPPHASPTALEI